MSTVLFKISGAEAQGVDATNDVTTDAFKLGESYDWSVSLNDTGVTGGPPTYTIEVSNNSSKWYEFNQNSTDVALADSVTAEYFGFKYMRVIYSANGTTAGTVDFELSINHEKVD